MKIYQLMFPDGDGYPIFPEFTYSNLPSLELVNKSLNDIDIEPLNKKKYKHLISKLNGKAYVKFNIKASSANWFYGNEMALKAIDVIDNPPVEVILYDNPEANKYLYINLKDVKFK